MKLNNSIGKVIPVVYGQGSQKDPVSHVLLIFVFRLTRCVGNGLNQSSFHLIDFFKGGGMINGSRAATNSYFHY